VSNALSKATFARAVSGVISGAIRGGMPPGSFRVHVDAERGLIDLLPVNGNESQAEPNELDAEIRALLDGKG
jgi:hypothetical protein